MIGRGRQYQQVNQLKNKAMSKKAKRPRPAPKAHDFKKDGTEGAILAEVAKAGLWKKPLPVVEKETNKGDTVN